MSRDRLEALGAFQRLLRFKFKDQSLLNRALTHRSYVNEDPRSTGNNERLEFLGDAVLGLVTAARLFTMLGDRSEGDLATVKSFVVSENTLSELAAGLGMDALLLVGKGEERSGGRNKKAILADSLEAVFGAAYIDSGFSKAEGLVLSLINPEIDKVMTDRHHKDYKTLLQEYAQKWHRCYPAYELDSKTGPDHDRTYWIRCCLLDADYGPASGKTKKDAEQAAAAIAYDAIIATGGLEAERLVSASRL
ncbi:MAG: ribonuclease III [Spirochaetae bacterium HGW-Spirochaetae-7]|jgi:ribonuclease-3|nr:MAG: ribonuclease III [Spirochaetae bacterium HGW-Spirochaetae-7]